MMRFVRYLLGKDERSGEEIPIDALDYEPGPAGSDFDALRAKLLLASWVVLNVLFVLVFVATLASIIYLAVIQHKEVPDLIKNTFWLTLGWLGQALFSINKNPETPRTRRQQTPKH